MSDKLREALDPCPFCGGEAEFERVGTPRQSCIVTCRNCGARHESSDENERSGASWNSRVAAAPSPPEQPAAQGELTDERIDAFYRKYGTARPDGFLAAARAVIAADRAARKRPEAEVAEIMEAVRLALSNKVSIHEVERLVRGERS